MNLRRSLLLLLLAGLGLAGTAARAAPEEGPDFHSCLLEAAGGQRSANAQCTELAVPLDPSRAGGPRIKLHLARLPSRAGKPEPDPLFFVAGGPGESASDGYLAEQGAFDAVLARRDIYLLDQRGTGGSHPLDCTMPAGQPVPAHLADWTRQCLAGFDVDPRFFTTTVAVEDLDRVRRRLGLQRINLYGVSYGTRVVLAYLRAHPEHVRAVVLDGVVPADRVLGPEIALNAQKAFDAMLDRCRGDSACAAAFPDLDAVFAKLLARLRSQPERVQLRDPTTGKPVTTTFTAAQLASAVRLLSYSTETVSLLPLLIWRAGQENDPAPLVAQARWVDAQVRGSLSLGMHNAVVCSEDAPRYPPGGSGALSDTFLGTLQMDELRTICAHWPAGIVAADFHQPVHSDRPVLLLSGQFDPITPPREAAHAARTLSNSLSVVAPGQGHGVAGRGCIPRLIGRFLDKASVKGLDTECVRRLRPAPFFLHFTGPGP